MFCTSLKRWSKSFVLVLCVVALWTNACFAASRALKGPARGHGHENLIVLMADGTGSTHTTITRWYKGAPLALDEMFLSGVRTYSADSLITDSAPVATAFATGHKTNDKFLGIYPSEATIPGVPAVREDLKYKPLATVLEAAKVAGKSVSLIATSNIQHASPAGYSAHVHSRSEYNEIAEQQVYLDIDVVFGGGRQYLIPTGEGGKRTDSEDLTRSWKTGAMRLSKRARIS